MNTTSYEDNLKKQTGFFMYIPHNCQIIMYHVTVSFTIYIFIIITE